MKQIGSIVRQTRQEPSLQSLQHTAKGEQVACLMKRFSTGKELVTTFNPDVGSRLPGNYEKVYNSDAPTIGLVSTAYGRDLSLQWINIQLNSIDQFTQVKNDLPESSRKELAELILSHYSALKLPEFMLFVARFKLGLYGKFYGSFDPIAFCEAIKKFMSDRTIELERMRIRTGQKEAEERAFVPPEGFTSLSWYQYLKQRAQEGDVNAIEQLKPPKQ